jgi:hypothetical protein
MKNLDMFEVLKFIYDSLVSFGPVERPCGFEYWPNHDMVLTSTPNKGVTIYSQSSKNIKLFEKIQDLISPFSLKKHSQITQ